MSMMTFWLISHAVLYRSLRFCGISGMCCTLPLLAMILFLISSLHRPSLTRSRSRYLFTTMNSPLSTRRV